MNTEQINEVLKHLDDIEVMTKVHKRDLQAGISTKLPLIAVACIQSSLSKILEIQSKTK